MIIVIVVVIVLGIGAFLAYEGFLSGVQGSPSTVPRVSDIPERPHRVWTTGIEVSGEIASLRAHDAGSEEALIVVEHDPDPDGIASLLDLILVDTVTGEQLWQERDLQPSARVSEGRWWVDGTSSPTHLGVRAHDPSGSRLLLYSKDDGSLEERSVGQIIGSRQGPFGIVVVQQTEGGAIIVERLSPEAAGEPVWQQAYSKGVDNEGDVWMCVVGDNVVVGTAVGGTPECRVWYDAQAYSLSSGDPLAWTERITEETVFHVLQSVIVEVRVERDPGTGIAVPSEVMAVASDGSDLWDEPLIRTFVGEPGGAHFIGNASMLVAATTAGLEAIDHRTGERLWIRSGEPTVAVGFLNDQVLAATPDALLWVDAATGASTHTAQVVNMDDPFLSVLAASDHHLYTSDGSGVLVAIGDSGQVSWSTRAAYESSVQAAGGRLLLLDQFASEVSGLG